MNSLSWLLYFADVLPNLAALFGFIGFLIVLVTGLVSLIVYGKLSKTPIFLLIFGCMLMFTATLVPSKNTIYAIAVSETGEKILQSEWGKRGGRAIDAWITKQLEESSSKSSK